MLTEAEKKGLDDLRSRRLRDDELLRAKAHLLCRGCWGKTRVEVYDPDDPYHSHVIFIPCPACSATGWADHET